MGGHSSHLLGMHGWEEELYAHRRDDWCDVYALGCAWLQRTLPGASRVRELESRTPHARDVIDFLTDYKLRTRGAGKSTIH